MSVYSLKFASVLKSSDKSATEGQKIPYAYMLHALVFHDPDPFI